jgi:3-oxoacyl-[acyl-carrier-protein] synthase III
MFNIQVDVDVVAAARALPMAHAARHDIDMLIKSTLTEAFAGAVVRPWSLHRQSGPVATIIGYSAIPVADVDRRLSLALPAIRVAIPSCQGLTE